jgi:hypothetical protein
LKVTELNSEREPATEEIVKLHPFSTKLLAIPFFDVIYKGRVAFRRADLNSEHCIKENFETLCPIMHNPLMVIEE